MRKWTSLPASFSLVASVTVAVLGMGATAWAASPLPSLQPRGWDDDIRLREAADRNPDPRIVEVDLEARVATVQVAGQSLEAWTYNGGIPGPLIRARVGDRLIVHFTNHLPVPTTVHWHGVRVPIQMDGVPEYSQPAVEPGQSFIYDFELHDATLFWYHPHVMSAAQVGFGLYGALLVEDPDDGVGIADQLVVVMSDISIDEQGKLESPESGGPAGMVFGREGNHTLINGRTSATLLATNGAPQRWRVVNAAKSRHFQLDLEGMVFTRIGADGGLQEYPETSNRIVLAAGERADVIVQPKPAPTRELVLRHIPYNRGYGSVEYRDVEDLVTVKIAEGPAYTGPPPARITRTIEPVPQAGATRVNFAFTLAQLPDGSFEYGIDGSPFNKGRSLRAAVGETQIWTVTNKTKWSHPFHLHGFFFQVLDEKDQPVRPLVWKDTMNIPLETSMRFIVKFDDRPGRWMFHCHILDHAEGGLMSSVLVGPGDDVAPDHHHHPSPAVGQSPGR